MTKIPACLLTILLVGQVAPALAGADGPVRLSVRIFEIPAEQSVELERSDGSGGILTLHLSGNIAARFPRGTVLIPTELAGNASESAVGEAIGRSVAFGSGELAVDRIRVRELRSFDARLDQAHPSEEARFEEARGEGRTSDYQLRVERLPGGPERPLFRFRLFVGWTARAGSLGAGFSEDVISGVAEVPDSKLLLIGAPGDKAVYFLAVSVQPR